MVGRLTRDWAQYNRLSNGIKQLLDLHRLFVLTHFGFHFHLRSHVALDYIWITDFCNFPAVLHEHRISALVGAIGVAGGVPRGLSDAGGIANPTSHLDGLVVLGVEEDQGSKDDREQHGASFHLEYLRRRGSRAQKL